MMSLRLLACAGVVASAPNIVVFLTDDQDVMLGGAFPTLGDATPMPRTRELLVERGATFTGMMVHTPICSPSRAELLTGRLLHNLKTTGGTLWQMHLDEERVHNYTFAARMKAAAGFRTGLFGKYLNAMPGNVASSRLTRQPPSAAVAAHGHLCHSHGPGRVPSS